MSPLFLGARIGFTTDQVVTSEGDIARIPVGITEGYLDVVVNATLRAIPGTAEGIIHADRLTRMSQLEYIQAMYVAWSSKYLCIGTEGYSGYNRRVKE